MGDTDMRWRITWLVVAIVALAFVAMFGVLHYGGVGIYLGNRCPVVGEQAAGQREEG